MLKSIQSNAKEVTLLPKPKRDEVENIHFPAPATPDYPLNR